MTGNRALSADVRFGSLADILGGLRHVCFTPKSGHRSARFMMSALCHFRNYARQKLFGGVLVQAGALLINHIAPRRRTLTPSA